MDPLGQLRSQNCTLSLDEPDFALQTISWMTKLVMSDKIWEVYTKKMEGRVGYKHPPPLIVALIFSRLAFDFRKASVTKP